ncbi:arginase/agmatinase/formimionoglutamate hydrolase [Pelotomaculum thermopropionicum SI]|uniref:Arginase/agmatinase/formimionoglutamate hydrolase n=1 Tax=Pelotomaculum thermopropionicum (strain DSM 13744 / JCM 10971 / SI) TaxID=370438 RepID=A5D3P7_PELTS|nr:arginase/agmatinase/formimionoglutamate hydrolase [Pelotomaculum thermopropionicum SI]
MLDFVVKYAGFMGSAGDYEQADVVLVGAPMDFTVSFRPGARQGPRQVRQVSYGLEEYSVDLERDLADYSFFDAGDIELPFGSVQESLRRIGLVAAEIIAAGKFPLFLGGEHLISFAVIKQAAKSYPGLAVIHLDAHADLREEYMGEFFSHATVMRRVADLIGGKNLYQFGIRSGAREEIEFARRNTNLFTNEVVKPLRENIQYLKGRPVYVSLDIDVVDPSFAPGTGTAEPGGCTAREILQAVHLMGGLNVVGFDLVEVSPLYDPSERTALLAAKLVREAILTFGRPRLK